ncbi:hypothetical protein PP756_gp16 [Pseudomonas phage VB_PaeP_VL1]|uniref:Uncharacterized protein n=1 Tax=Pseudomonas phage VB_PaeP_VL1 TaxID=2894395 RepID=A0AAE9CGF9_9CAUD|nr:hypothetical protein PP756_gp16 [Pseudomonas phage VB_PaeP_VL1]UGV19812.1 hypothetical protein vBPaePVL1_16 [Pseudomonas phage VB_PaeP_VL1]
MPTDLETISGGVVTGDNMSPVTARALAALYAGRTVLVNTGELEKVALHLECRNLGKLFEEIAHVYMDETEQMFLVTLVKLGECPAQKPKGAHAISKWEMPVRNHEINHLGKGPRNKFGGFN